ncbi:hypothetical protein [Propionibacterium ruminifibrarum]|uniref:hypothetical protein n=1 Tax=Propionibacterium ruminifibrarum TaxID=1962131 RepID=UPI0011C42C11|nr:hypothetical protein [Propionibacterium ruminifibrarum]
MTEERRQWIPETVAHSLNEMLHLVKEVKLFHESEPLSNTLHFLCNWLLVRSCGHIEVTEQACIENLYQRKFGAVVYHYLDETSFKTGRNPRYSNLLMILKRIENGDILASNLKSFLDNDYLEGKKYKDYLEMIVEGRNAIVHGYSFDIEAIRALDCARASAAISNWYLEQFKPGGIAEQAVSQDDEPSESANHRRRKKTATQLKK